MPVRLISAETIRNDPGIKDPEFDCLRSLGKRKKYMRAPTASREIEIARQMRARGLIQPNWMKRRERYLIETGKAAQ